MYIYEHYLSTVYICYMVCTYQGTPAGIMRFVWLIWYAIRHGFYRTGLKIQLLLASFVNEHFT